METRNCQNCKSDFTITPDDFGFYEKIKVPPPTFCPTCRSVRRMAEPNERVLYKRKCDLSGQDIFSMYPFDAPFPVYETGVWNSDEWDPYQYGVEYDFSKPFFQQFQELRNRVPRMALVRQGFSINSEYTHRVNDMKNSYMVFRATRSLNSMYLYNVKDVSDCVDCFEISKCQLCFECIDCHKSYNLRFSQESFECRDSMFLYACRNCSNCVGCVNLVNQEYCIFNEKYTKEDYTKKVEELRLDTSDGIKKMEITFSEFRKKFPQKAIVSIKAEDVSGNWLYKSKNVQHSFSCINVKDGKYLYFVFEAQDCMDYFQWGNASELIYDSENCGISSSRLSFCTQCWAGAHDLLYCDSCIGSGYCFGCIGLKKGEYVILNKQYTKEEYEELLPKILNHMNEMPYVDEKALVYKFGEHFPSELSTCAYNETAAGDYYPLTKDEAVEKGYKWKDREKKVYNITLASVDLPQTIKEVDSSILNEVIECEEKDGPQSVGAFRITENELAFYKKMNLPLPRACFDIRHSRRFRKRPPLRLILRSCSKCNKEAETVYTKEYSPIIYCEACYQQEVY